VSNRNIISAKLSFLVMLLMVGLVALLDFTYAKTEHWTLEARVFLNALCIDVGLVVVTPLVLLYSSLELRQTIWHLLRARACHSRARQ
jgi:hypothetical protein